MVGVCAEEHRQRKEFIESSLTSIKLLNHCKLLDCFHERNVHDDFHWMHMQLLVAVEEQEEHHAS